VHHWYRQYGHSQFFKVARVTTTLLALLRWWWRLVVKREHLRPKAPTAVASDGREPRT
jgi:hypothetical protein